MSTLFKVSFLTTMQQHHSCLDYKSWIKWGVSEWDVWACKPDFTFLTQSHIPWIVGGCVSSAFFIEVSSFLFIFGVVFRDVDFLSLDEGVAEEKWGSLKMVSDVVGCVFSL